MKLKNRPFRNSILTYRALPFRPSLFQHHFEDRLISSLLIKLFLPSAFTSFDSRFPVGQFLLIKLIQGAGLNASITRIEHMKSLMLLHSKKIETIFDLIPRCKKFSKTVRDTIVVNTFTKLLLLRIVSFSRNDGQSGRSWRSYSSYRPLWANYVDSRPPTWTVHFSFKEHFRSDCPLFLNFRLLFRYSIILLSQLSLEETKKELRAGQV